MIREVGQGQAAQAKQQVKPQTSIDLLIESQFVSDAGKEAIGRTLRFSNAELNLKEYKVTHQKQSQDDTGAVAHRLLFKDVGFHNFSRYIPK